MKDILGKELWVISLSTSYNFHLTTTKTSSQHLSGGGVLAENGDTNNVGVGIELELLLLDRSVSWVGGVEDIIKFLKLLSLLALHRRRIIGGLELTVRFFVSGAKKKKRADWMKHHTKKTM